MPRRTATLLAACLTSCFAVTLAPTAMAERLDPNAAVVHSNNAMAIDLYRQFVEAGESNDNVFFSPLSITSALMLTYEGARGETEDEFEKVLGIPSTDPARLDGLAKIEYHRALGKILKGYNEGDERPFELAVANGLWGEKTMPFRNEFVETLGEHYKAPLKQVDFSNDAENQRQAINAWVSKQTQDRINDLLPDGSVDAMTKLVLVNAIYFKAPWVHEFSERKTTDQPFTLLPAEGQDAGETVEVPLMHQTGERFRYGDYDGYDALAMYYQGGDFSMIVLLPDQTDGLADLEAKLDADQLAADLDAMQLEMVNLWLPKWEMTLSYDLAPPLKAMGLNKAFEPGAADFTGISDSADGEGLYISAAVHKAFIAVDEKGTEAAAATAIAIGLTSAPPPPDRVIDFRVDRPFVYLIRDNQSGAILFMGRVTDPS